MDEYIKKADAVHALCKAVHKDDGVIPCENQTTSCLLSKTRVCDYAREIDALPSEDVIPVSWIEERIKWLIGTGDEFALLTAKTFFSLLMAWRDKAKDDWASYEKDGEQND